jgi:RDD family
VRDDGEPVDLGTAVRRYGTLYGLSLLFGLGSLFDFLWPLSDSSNRALHDKAARTHVVNTAGQSRRNPAGVIVVAGIGYVVLIGVLIAVAGASFTSQAGPTAAAQSAYVAASQMFIQAEQASGACAATADHSGPFSEPACLTAKVSALAVALGNLSTANINAQSGLSAGPCATALSHESQVIRATQAAVHNAVQALRAGDSAAFSQAQQQASAAQQAAASSEAQYPLSACASTPGQSATSAA